MLSDGAPVDDSTLSVNAGNFLESHLIATVNWLKTTKDVEICGIGIGHDISRYYGPGTPTLSDAVGPDLLDVVSLAISNQWAQAGSIQKPTPPPPPARPRRRRKGDKGAT